MEDQVKKISELDEDKITLVKPQLKSKWRIWLSFIFFGWSYGSLGNLGVQLLWYVIPIITAFGIYQHEQTRQFTIFTSLALVGFFVWIAWGAIRLVTLNKAIIKYNRTIASFYGLTDDEKELLGIE